MSSFWFELVFILVLLLANGFFAMAEMAVVASRKPRLQQQAEDGDKRAAAALRLATDPSSFLSAVQIGITLVGILMGAFGGATIARELSSFLDGIPAMAQYSDALALLLVVILITFLSLVVGELAPKRLALNAPEKIAKLVARPMTLLTRVTAPIVTLLNTSTSALLRLLGVRPSREPPVTEEEIQVMVEQGAQAGVFSPAESRAVLSVFRLGDLRVGAIMTPRTQVSWLEADDTLEQVRCKIAESGHGQMPVCEGDLDHVLGIVSAKQLLACGESSEDFDLRSVCVPAVFAPEQLPAVRLLALFEETDADLVLVVDEYGGVLGIVTMHDVLDAAVGDLMAGGMFEAPSVVRRPDGSWLLDGMLPVDRARELLDIPQELPGEAEGTFATVGGFAMTVLGRIPVEGDSFEWEGWAFEVLDMDGRRVDKLLVRMLPDAADAGTP